MQYRKMPRNGDALSVLGFGCMRLPLKDGKIDEPRAIRQIRDAINCGVNYVDTAWPYHAGESEPLLGKALRDGYRNRIKLATKLPSWMIKSRADMDRFLAAQLKKLETDHIDYYLLHALDGAVWDNVSSSASLNFSTKRRRTEGSSTPVFPFTAWRTISSASSTPTPGSSARFSTTIWTRRIRPARWALSTPPPRSGRHRHGTLRGGNLGLAKPPPAIEAIWNEARVRRTPAEWALRWIWNRPEVTVVLSGMNEESHIRENLALADTAKANALTPEELTLVDRVSEMYRELMKVGCTGCGYCMPCPAHVTIPICFEEYNRINMFGAVEEGKFRYAFRMSGDLVDGRPGYASQCVNCGACLKKCPQQIPIPDVLKQVVADMEDAELPNRVAMARTIFQVKA